MAKRSRKTLKNYFQEGKRPTEKDFEDLIDSTLNTLDDGFSGSPQIGIGLAPLSQNGTIISTYRHPGDANPVWEIAINRDNADLQIKRCNENIAQPVITLKHDQKKNSTQEIRFDGIVCSPARKGTYKCGTVPANGQWHDIIGDGDRMQDGCWAFEVVAGCGERSKGRYALVVATALHCFGNNPKIHKVRSHFGYFGNKIGMRWLKVKDKFSCKLQVKTRSSYGEDAMIHYQITNLWDNPFMENNL
jgi:hypothetical protein